MLTKLLKYEFRATARLFGLCYLGTLGAALLLRIMATLAWDHTWEYSSQMEQLFPMRDVAAGMSGALYAIMIAAVVVLTFIVILQRFYKNLLGGEGYLMHTLPVRPWEHITAKLIAAVVWSVLSTIVIFLSLFVVGMDLKLIRELFADLLAFSWYFQAEFHFPLIVAAGELIFVLLVSTVASVLQIYAAIMLGHQAQKHKIALAVGAYFGIGMVLNVAMSILLNVLFVIVEAAPDSLLDAVGAFLENLSVMQAYHLVILFMLLFNLILSVLFFVMTERLMRRNLNLE